MNLAEPMTTTIPTMINHQEIIVIETRLPVVVAHASPESRP